MEIDKWIGTYKVRAFPWIDGKRIYFNVQYYAPGQSVVKPPVWDRSVYIEDNEEGQRLVYEYTHSLTHHIAGLRQEIFNRPSLKVDPHSESVTHQAVRPPSEGIIPGIAGGRNRFRE